MISMQKNHQTGQFFTKPNATWDEELSHSLWLLLYLKSYPILTQTPPGEPALSRSAFWCTACYRSLRPANRPYPQGPANNPNRGEKLENQWSLGEQTLCVRWQTRRLDTGTQASRSLCSLLRGYIRNVKLHQTISAQHPHESGGGVREGRDGVR